MSKINVIVGPNVRGRTIELTTERLGFSKQLWNKLSDIEKHNAISEYIAENNNLEPICYVIKNRNSMSTIIDKIENSLERWHLGRIEDSEAIEEISQTLFDIGRLTWFNPF